MSEQARKRIAQGFVVVYAICLLFYRFYLLQLGDIATEFQNNLWWVGIVVLGSMMIGFLFEPMTKASFPNENDSRVKENPELKLEDHEVMTGHYGFAALTVLVVSLIVSPLFYGRQLLFEVQSLNFVWAVIATGCLNVGIFYFFIKAIRYGDISQVSMLRGLIPILTLPISYLVYVFVGSSGVVSPPYVSWIGLLGIVLVVSAILVNVAAKGSKKKPVEISKLAIKDWFARHPVVSAGVSACFACFAINFDKVAVDSANPFLFGTITMLIIASITFVWVLQKKGWSRIRFLFKNYLSNFIKVGVVYGLIIICMNVGLFGNNVNYVGSTKRVSIIFATLFGVLILREGLSTKHKIVRVITSLLVVGGIFLMMMWG